MRRRRREAPQLGVLALVALAATLLSVAARRRRCAATMPRTRGRVRLARPRRRAAPAGRRRPARDRRPEDAVARRPRRTRGRPSATEAQQRRWTAAALAAHNQLIAELAQQGVRVRPEYQLRARVRPASRRRSTRRRSRLLERTPEVAGVYPVRIDVPGGAVVDDDRAEASGGRSRGPFADFAAGLRRATASPSRCSIRASRRNHPYLLGQVGEGRDVVDRDGECRRPSANPDDATRLERHGTQLAGIVVGSDGPGRARRRRAGVPASCRSASRAGSENARGTWSASSAAPTSSSPGSSVRSTRTATAARTTPRGSRSSASPSRLRPSWTARRRAPSPARCASTRSSSRPPGTTGPAGPGTAASPARADLRAR